MYGCKSRSGDDNSWRVQLAVGKYVGHVFSLEKRILASFGRMELYYWKTPLTVSTKTIALGRHPPPTKFLLGMRAVSSNVSRRASQNSSPSKFPYMPIVYVRQCEHAMSELTQHMVLRVEFGSIFVGKKKTVYFLRHEQPCSLCVSYHFCHFCYGFGKKCLWIATIIDAPWLIRGSSRTFHKPIAVDDCFNRKQKHTFLVTKSPKRRPLTPDTRDPLIERCGLVVEEPFHHEMLVSFATPVVAF